MRKISLFSKPLTAGLAAVLLLSGTVAGAGASTERAPIIAAGTHYDLVDAQGNVVGELVSESATRVRLRIIDVTPIRAVRSVPPAQPDREFHPDYRGALSVGQMSAAWQAEIDHLFPPPPTGGG
jgi:hypothetical protein